MGDNTPVSVVSPPAIIRATMAAGHPTRVPFWRELRARAYDRPMARVNEPETTAFGAAIMAAHALQGETATDLVASRTEVKLSAGS